MDEDNIQLEEPKSAEVDIDAHDAGSAEHQAFTKVDGPNCRNDSRNDRRSYNIFICDRCGQPFRGTSAFRSHITRKVRCIDKSLPHMDALIEHDRDKTLYYVDKIDTIIGGDSHSDKHDDIRLLIRKIKSLNLYDDRTYFNVDSLNEFIDSTKQRLS